MKPSRFTESHMVAILQEAEAGMKVKEDAPGTQKRALPCSSCAPFTRTKPTATSSSACTTASTVTSSPAPAPDPPCRREAVRRLC